MILWNSESCPTTHIKKNFQKFSYSFAWKILGQKEFLQNSSELVDKKITANLKGNYIHETFSRNTMQMISSASKKIGDNVSKW
jgi:hypothetical protein